MASNPQTSVVVVGSGRFGRHYPRVLAGICRDRLPDLPQIKRLVITATDLNRAQQRAAELARDHGDAIPAIIGESVADAHHLVEVLDRYRPVLTCIVARDPAIGDAIHARYSQIALTVGRVLCEKPFAPADGNNRSVSQLDALAARFPPDRFGLELPMAVAARAMAAHPILGPKIERAGTIHLLWQRPEPSTIALIPDLSLHPWSLLPADIAITAKRISITDRTADLLLTLARPGRSMPVPCRIRLETGGAKRRLTLDDWTVAFDFDAGVMAIRQTDTKGNPISAPPLLTVANPLRQHMEAMLRGNPIVGFERARAAQAFLETVYTQR